MEDHSLSRLLHEVRKTAADGVGDAELLGRFAATGDEAAFELLVRRHQGLVFGVCRRILGDHHDAEDAFQATFLALARKAGGVGRREAVAGWLFRVAHRTALAARAGRARRTNRERPVAAAETTAAPADAAASPERREAWSAVDEEVSRLPERFRTAAVLCYLEGKTVDEAARLLGCPRGTVASRLARARKRLHTRLTRRGVGLAIVVGATAEALVRPTVRAVVLYASGKAAGQGVSLTAVALARKVVRAMFVKKLTTGATVMAALAGVLLLGGGLSTWMRTNAAAAPPAAQAAAPTAVTVSRPVRREVTPSEDFTGRLALAEPLPVVTRVGGRYKLNERLRQPKWEPVKKGDLLFEIDPAPLKADLTRAEAALDLAPASDRSAAQVAVEHARQDLEAARVVAPIDGRVQSVFGYEGETISGTWAHPAGLLALDPRPEVIGVRFEMDERTFLRYQRLLAAREAPGVDGPLHVGLSDETSFPHDGLLASFDDHFNPDTGTIAVRGLFPDAGGLLLPGMFARVRVPFGKPAPALQVTEEAVFADQGKHYVWVVNDLGVAERREVRLGGEDGGMRVVEEGVGPDDWVVVAGGKDLHAGDKVEPCRAAMPGSKAKE